jgi:histone deacetylase complex regulatory component SIN3
VPSQEHASQPSIPPATPVTVPTTAVVSPEEEKIRSELQDIFIDLLTSAQELSYEMATLEPKDVYTKDEIKDFLEAARRVVANVKRMHQFLKVHARRR